MTVITLPGDEEDFAKSVSYYQAREPGLGERFRDAVTEAVAWIMQNPEVPRLRTRGYRRVNLRAFPHYIAYVIRADSIFLVSIAHAHRRPEFWIHRL